MVDCLENISRGSCDRFSLPDVLKKTTWTTQLIKLDDLDENIRRPENVFSFSISYEFPALKQNGKITDNILQPLNFKQSINVLFCTMFKILKPNKYGHLSPINMAEITNVCEKDFHRLIQKLVDSNHMTLSEANCTEQEYKEILFRVVKEKKIYFCEFDELNGRLDEYLMRLLNGTFQYTNFMLIVQMMLTLAHRKADMSIALALLGCY